MSLSLHDFTKLASFLLLSEDTSFQLLISQLSVMHVKWLESLSDTFTALLHVLTYHLINVHLSMVLLQCKCSSFSCAVNLSSNLYAVCDMSAIQHELWSISIFRNPMFCISVEMWVKVQALRNWQNSFLILMFHIDIWHSCMTAAGELASCEVFWMELIWPKCC